MHNERFITFEGGEGAGKSTQICLLAARLRDFSHEVVLTREPGGTPLAEKLRAFILAGKARDLGALGEAILFSAARIDHIDQLIRPALARGAIVLCDRFADSTRAYQGVQRRRCAGTIGGARKGHAGRGPTPGMTFILDLPPQVGLERAQLGGAAAARLTDFEGRGARISTRNCAPASSKSPEPSRSAAAVIDCTRRQPKRRRIDLVGLCPRNMDADSASSLKRWA